MLAIIISVVAGIATTTQASFNAEARRITKSPYFSTAFNFVFSLLALFVITLVTEHNLFIPLSKVAEYPLWIWCGGMCGPVIIMMNILCLPKLGSAKNMMLACTGQILTGLIIDQFGMFGSQQIGMNPERAIGAALVLGGIFASSFEKGRKDEESNNKDAIFIFSILALVNGIAAAVQVAANGTLNTVVGSAPKTTIISMAVGLFTISLVMLILSILRGPDTLFDGDGKFHFVKPHIMMVYGGLCAVIVVGGNAVAAVVIGTGLVNILNLAGMMATSLTIDAAGFLGIRKKPVTAYKVIGMLMIVAGAAIISLIG